MRKILFLLFATALFISCSFPNYIIENKAQTLGLDFTQGKWLLNDIDCPGNVYKELTQMSERDFGSYLQDRLFPVYGVREIILPRKINFNPSKNKLLEIKKGCDGFDYFINIRAGKLKEEVGPLDIKPQNRISQERSNRSEVLIEVYDLNLAQIIYSQKVIGTTIVTDDLQEVHLAKTSRSLLLEAYNKIMKDIDKKSIKN
jgi:hypothetical protein